MKFLLVVISLIFSLFVASSYAACPSGQQLCGATRCYNPVTQQCIYPENIVCLSNQQLCGTKCFTPLYETCNQPNNLVCPNNYAPCPGNLKCYNTLGGSC